MFGFRLPRAAALLIAAAFLIIALLLLGLYLWSPRATLRITTGPTGGIAQRFISAFVSVTTKLHPNIRFETVPVADLEASSKAMEDGRVDIQGRLIQSSAFTTFLQRRLSENSCPFLKSVLLSNTIR